MRSRQKIAVFEVLFWLLLLPATQGAADSLGNERAPGGTSSKAHGVPTAALPSPRFTGTASFSFDTAAAYGLQRVLPQGQLVRGSYSVDAGCTIGSNRVEMRSTGMPGSFWGYLGVRKQLLTRERDGIDLVLDSLVSLPSWSVSITPWFGCTVGMGFPQWGWYAGAQAGLFSAPIPNQRPLGPSPMIIQYGGFYLRLLRGLTLHVEEASGLSSGVLLAAVRWSVGDFTFTAAAPAGWAAVQADAGFILMPPGIRAGYEVQL